MTKAGMKPITQMNGPLKRILPRYIVNSQLNTFGDGHTRDAKDELTLGPPPIVKKRCSRTSQDTSAMTAVA